MSLRRGTTYTLQQRIKKIEYDSDYVGINSNAIQEKASVWAEAQLTHCNIVSQRRSMAVVRHGSI
jgi:hypothetical protein